MGIKYNSKKLRNEQYFENKAVSTYTRLLRLKRNTTTYAMKKPKPYNNEEFTRVTLNPYQIDLSKYPYIFNALLKSNSLSSVLAINALSN